MKRSTRKPVLKDVSMTKSISARIPRALLERVRKVRRRAERQGRTFNLSSVITRALEKAMKSAEAELKALSRQHSQ
jgi:hypothetical protein